MRKNMTQIYEANLMMVRHIVQMRWGMEEGGEIFKCVDNHNTF